MYNKKFEDLIDGKGNFNDEAKKHLIAEFKKTISEYLEYANSPNQTRIIGGSLNSIINDCVSDKIRDKK